MNYQQQQPPPPYSPYAPPAPGPMYRQNIYVPPGVSPPGPLPGSLVSTLYLVTGLVMAGGLVVGVGLIIAGAAMGNDGEVLAMIGMLFCGLAYMSIFVYAIVNALWIYKMWSWVPPSERHTNMWRKYISPGTALGFMFIPYFNVYWMFVVYLGLGDIFDRMSLSHPTGEPSPKGFAIATLVVSMIFFPAAPFMHWAFAKKCERIANAMNARMQGQGLTPGAGPGGYGQPGYGQAY